MTPSLAKQELARLSQIRAGLLTHHPFWGHLLLQVSLVPSPDLPAFAATDCLKHIWFNPNKTQHLDLAQLGFVMVHELCHQVFLSRDRGGDRNPHLWNCATDYAINRMVANIRDPGLADTPLYRSPNGTYPGEGTVEILLDTRFDGLVAEAIYTLLQADQLPSPHGVELALPMPGSGREIQPPGCSDHGGGIDIHLPIDLSPAERKELSDRIKTALARAGKPPGDTAGGRIREVRPTDSKVDWRTQLHSLLSPYCGAPDEFDRTRPSRRWLARGLFQPGMRAERLGRLVAAVDTSGSMTEATLAQVLGELRALAPLAEDLTVLVADTEVHEVLDVDEALERLDRGGWKGGGGTDHRPVFEWIANSGSTPDTFIGLTDLFTRLPDRAPNFPVVWVVPGNHGKVPWGRLITLPDAPNGTSSLAQKRPRKRRRRLLP